MQSLFFGAGYLGKKLIDYDKTREWIICKTTNDIVSKCEPGDELWYFACPSYDFKENMERLYETIDLTSEVIRMTKDFNLKLIYASSKGMFDLENEYEPQKIYNALKWINTKRITFETKNSKILEIPRVYGSDRPNGLMRALRLGKIVDENKELEFIDINNFCRQTFELLKGPWCRCIYETETATIGEIKKRYVPCYITKVDYKILDNYTIQYERISAN